MASMDNKVSNHIPDDLAVSILSKLPLVSIKRFTCVHTSWAILFQNPNFMSVFSKNFISKYHSYYDDTCLLLKKTLTGYEYDCAFYRLSGNRFENQVKLDLPSPFKNNDNYIQILGSSVNGIVCLYQRRDHVYSFNHLLCQKQAGIDYDNRIVLWKPTTEEFTVIPSGSDNYFPYDIIFTTAHGFGYDSVSDDYKVIRHAPLFESFYRIDGYIDRHQLCNPKFVGNLWEIYSLKSNSWRKLDVDMVCRDYQSVVVYINGMCHWWGKQCDEEYMVSFDLSNEVFLTTPLPLDMCPKSYLVKRHLAILNMSISLISNYSKDTTFHISILGQFGVRESWTKLFIVGPLLGVDHPIGVGKKGEIFFRKKNTLAYFDLSTGIIEEISIQEKTNVDHIIIYK